MDREKVIKALECRKNADKRCGNPCEESGMCHYATAVRDINGEIYRPFICDKERICVDALALIDTQYKLILELQNLISTGTKMMNAVKPKSKVRHGASPQIQHFCGNCNAMLHGKPKFCSNCGKGVLW